MKDRNVQWLYRELPQWVSQNVITEETAEQIYPATNHGLFR